MRPTKNQTFARYCSVLLQLSVNTPLPILSQAIVKCNSCMFKIQGMQNITRQQPCHEQCRIPLGLFRAPLIPQQPERVSGCTPASWLLTMTGCQGCHQSLGVPCAVLLWVSGWQEAMLTPRRLQAVSSRNDLPFQMGKRLNQSCIHWLLLACIGHEQRLGFNL